MTEQDRANWLSAARLTLTGMPRELLIRGCKLARETCQFASQIVPTIMAEANRGDYGWKYLKRRLAEEEARAGHIAIVHRKPDYVSVGQAQIMAWSEIGADTWPTD